MAWIYLLIASLAEICWFYCIQRFNSMSWSAILDLSFAQGEGAILNIIAIVGYAVFGVINVWFFSKAVKTIHATIAFSVWTGVALCGTTIVDAFVLHLDFTLTQGFFMALIAIGIVGMKFLDARKEQEAKKS